MFYRADQSAIHHVAFVAVRSLLDTDLPPGCVRAGPTGKVVQFHRRDDQKKT